MGDTMRDGFEEEVCRHFDPERANFYLVRDEQSGRYHEWGVMLAWECYRAAHEAGRQLGMEQARAEPITVYQLCAAHTGRAYSIGVTVPAATHRICPLCESIHTPPAGDSDTQS